MSQGQAAPMVKKLPPVMDLLKMAVDMVMKRKGLFLTLSALPAVIMVIGGLITAVAPLLVAITVLLVIAAVIVGVLASIGMMLACANEGAKDWRILLKEAMQHFWPLLFTSIIVGIVVMIGLFLLVLPGIYLAIAFSFASYVVVFGGKKYWEAAKESKELVKGNWWAVLGRILALAIIVMIISAVFAAIGEVVGDFVGAVVSALLNIVIAPVSVAYQYLMYKALKQGRMDMPKMPPSPDPEMPTVG